MLRLMFVKRAALALTLAFALSSCGEGAVGEGGKIPERDRLLKAADAAAHHNSGEARHVEAVKTTRGAAGDLTGNSPTDRDLMVWILQVSGDHFVCGSCSGPAGSSTPEGDYLRLVLNGDSFESTDFGIGPQAVDLATMGEVHVLRE